MKKIEEKYQNILNKFIEKYKVSELRHLWVKSNKKELKAFLKNREKWRREHK